MRVLITGGAGFIGRNLTNHLVEVGYEVVSYDRVYDEEGESHGGQVLHVPGDVTLQGRTSEQVSQADHVIHLAARPGVRDNKGSGIFEVNTKGTYIVAMAAAEARCKSMVLASTAGAIYGGCGVADEDCLPHPTSTYGASKLAAEAFLYPYIGRSLTTFSALRLSNVYGPGSDHKNNLIPNALRAAQGDGKVSVHGDGKKTRDFIHVYEVCYALRRAMEKRVNGVYNICFGHSYSIKEALELVQKVTGKELSISYGPSVPGEVDYVHLQSRYAERYLGFVPGQNLSTGLLRTWRAMGHGG